MKYLKIVGIAFLVLLLLVSALIALSNEAYVVFFASIIMILVVCSWNSIKKIKFLGIEFEKSVKQMMLNIKTFIDK